MVSDRSNGVDRGKYTTARLIWGLVAAVALCASLLGYGLLESANYERQANTKSRHYAEYTSDKVAESCVGISRVEKINCLYEATDKKREYEYNQRDLTAQKQSALWGYVMALAAVIGLGLSAVGVWLVKTTFDETRKANSIARETMFRQLRAYVTAESAERNHDNRFEGYSGLECVSITLHNSGATPATGVKVIYDRMEIIDGVMVKTANKVELPDIGVQARQSIVVGFHRWQDFQTAGLEVEKTISGQVFFYPVVPDEDGESSEIVVNFSLEIFDAITKGDLRVAITSLPHKNNF